jgi:hypothetical protein
MFLRNEGTFLSGAASVFCLRQHSASWLSPLRMALCGSGMPHTASARSTDFNRRTALAGFDGPFSAAAGDSFSPSPGFAAGACCFFDL